MRRPSEGFTLLLPRRAEILITRRKKLRSCCRGLFDPTKVVYEVERWPVSTNLFIFLSSVFLPGGRTTLPSCAVLAAGFGGCGVRDIAQAHDGMALDLLHVPKNSCDAIPQLVKLFHVHLRCSLYVMDSRTNQTYLEFSDLSVGQGELHRDARSHDAIEMRSRYGHVDAPLDAGDPWKHVGSLRGRRGRFALDFFDIFLHPLHVVCRRTDCVFEAGESREGLVQPTRHKCLPRSRRQQVLLVDHHLTTRKEVEKGLLILTTQ